MKNLSDEDTRNILEAYFKGSLDIIKKKQTPDYKDVDEEQHLKIEYLTELNKNLKETNTDLSENRDLRRKYASRSWWFLCTYTVTSFLLILADGFSFLGFDLHPAVLSVISGSTAVSAIGLVMQVNKGLFGDGKS